MAGNVGNDSRIDQRLRRLISEPVRLKILLALSERAAGASELAEELGLDVSEISAQLERMRESGLVEVAGDALGRDSIEPTYRAAVRALWSDEEWAELSQAERRRVSAWNLEAVNAEVCGALESGTFDGRDDTHFSNTVLLVDEQGWNELVRIHTAALEAVLAVQEASVERLDKNGQERVRVLSAIICTELPRRSSRWR